MSNNTKYDMKYLVNEPYFNFINAIDELGFDFDSFKKNNFREFINNFIKQYRDLRTVFIKKDINEFKRKIHAIKGAFSLILCDKIKDECISLETLVKKSQKIIIDKEYADFLVLLESFFEKLIEMTQRINHPADQRLIDDFYATVKKFQNIESQNVNFYYKTNKNIPINDKITGFVISYDDAEAKPCCNDKCRIF